LAGPHKKEFTDQLGVCVWNEHIQAVDEMWEGISKRLGKLDVEHANLRIYQDGLPLCGRELDIVRECRGTGKPKSPPGAFPGPARRFLEGTEDVQLLLEEYRYIQAITGERKPAEKRTKAKLLSNKRKLLLCRR